MRARRVLLIEEGGVGGVAEYTAELAAALAGAGWDVHVATARDHRYPPAAGVTIHRLFAYVRGRGRLASALRRRGLSRPANGLLHLAGSLLAVRLARRCAVVHVQSEEWPPLGALQAVLLRATGRRFAYTPHNTFDRGERTYRRSHALIRRCAGRIVVHSAHDRAVLPARAAAKAVVIAHGEYGGLARRGAPDTDPAAARAAIGAAEEELVVLLFGQLRPDKGVRDLLLAARDVAGVRVVLAGEDQGALTGAADLLGTDRTIVREGFVPAHEAGRWFAAADVVALPYRRASASGVLLLAYGYGRPAVAYPVGGLPEYVVDGETGWLCETADPPGLARALRAIVAAGRDGCRARGAAGRAMAEERFGWPAVARATVEIYPQLVRGKSLDRGRRRRPRVAPWNRAR
jgi:glycosyltransferase involved in cell wall biosynthesis